MSAANALVERAIIVARDVRAELLNRAGIKRNLTGQCGLAAMHIAAALQAPRVLCVGFYMKHETFCGHYGRYPNGHAWCQIGDTIVDPTATQFGRKRAVHVVLATEDDHYIKTEHGREAINTILRDWCGADLPEYRRLAARLRRCR